MVGSDAREEYRQISQLAFRSEWKLPLLIALQESVDGSVTLKGLSVTLDIDPSSLSKAVHDFVALGILIELPPQPGQRSKFLSIAREHAIWPWVDDLVRRSNS